MFHYILYFAQIFLENITMKNVKMHNIKRMIFLKKCELISLNMRRLKDRASLNEWVSQKVWKQNRHASIHGYRLQIKERQQNDVAYLNITNFNISYKLYFCVCILCLQTHALRKNPKVVLIDLGLLLFNHTMQFSLYDMPYAVRFLLP